MADDLLTFEVSQDGDELEIHGDRAGLMRLARTLEALASRPAPDHDHLFTPDWAGDELSSEAQGEGKVLNKVTIRHWASR